MRRIPALLLLMVALWPSAPARSAAGLQQELEAFVADKPASIGIAVIINGNRIITVNNGRRYPLMSVFKFHQALAVANRLRELRLPLDTKLWITARDLAPDTWSPLRDARPGGNFSISIADLLRATLQQSDNNACDILFERLCSVADTEAYIHGLESRDCAIRVTEAEMHADPANCRKNWTTPLAAARLLETFLTRDILPAASRAFIKDTMTGCVTGQDRLAAPLDGTGAIFGHKTGTGDREADGRLMACNDLGFVLLPDGRRYVIAVFISDSRATDAATARMLADISALVYRHVAASGDAESGSRSNRIP